MMVMTKKKQLINLLLVISLYSILLSCRCVYGCNPNKNDNQHYPSVKTATLSAASATAKDVFNDMIKKPQRGKQYRSCSDHERKLAITYVRTILFGHLLFNVVVLSTIN